MDTGSDRDLITFRVFTILFPRSMMVDLNATINKLLIFKTYNQSNIEQLSKCTVKIRHNDKGVKCRFFEVPGDGQALLKMPNIRIASHNKNYVQDNMQQNNW